MAMLVWLILALCKVCAFSWIPVFIDSLIAMIIIAIKKEADGINLLFYIVLGIVYFSALKVFVGLTLPFWCLIFAPLFALAAFYVPGAHTILILILKFTGLTTLSTVGLIICLVIGVVLDVLIFIGMRKSNH